MRPLVKVGLVVGGYIVAFLAAFAVVAIYVKFTNGLDRQGSDGMSAFGDSLLFLALFGVAAVPPTGAALFFLRPFRSFWPVLSITALVIAATSLAAVLAFVASRSAEAGSTLSVLAVLRIFVAPLFALVFFLSGLFAPTRSSRIALFVATTIEVMAFVCVVFLWLHAF
jgi:hypothetical protein